MVAPCLNTFEGITDGTTVDVNNSGGLCGDPFNVTSSGSGSTLIADSTHAAHGSRGLKVATSATPYSPFVAWTETRLGKLKTSWVRFYLFITANPAANHRVMTFIGGGTARGGVLVTTTGKLRSVDAAGATIQNTATSIALNQWIRVEVMLTGDASTGQVIVQLYNSPEATTPTETITSAASFNTGGDVDAWRFGLSASQASVGPYWIDDPNVSADGWIGPFDPFNQNLIDPMWSVDTHAADAGVPGRSAVLDGTASYLEVPLGADPTNLLGGDSAGFEASAGSWAAVTNCAVARSTAQSYAGSASLAVTATAGGEVKAESPIVPVSPGQTVRGQIATLAQAAGRVMYAKLSWTLAGAPVSSVAGPATTCYNGVWVTATVEAVAPGGVDGVRLLLDYFTPGASEVVYVDDARLLLGAGSPFSIPTTGELTVMALMRPDSLRMAQREGSGYVHWLGKGTPGEHEWTFRMYQLGNTENRQNRISCYAFNLNGGLGNGSYFQDPLVPGEWMLITGAWDATSVAIYRDGVKRDTDPLDQSATSGPVITPAWGSAPVRIGTRDFGSYFQGGMSRVAIWNRRLSDGEITALQTARAAGTLDDQITATSGLVGFWKLDEGDGATQAVDTAAGRTAAWFPAADTEYAGYATGQLGDVSPIIADIDAGYVDALWLTETLPDGTTEELWIKPAAANGGGIWFNDLDLGYADVREIIEVLPGRDGADDYTSYAAAKAVSVSVVVVPTVGATIGASMDRLTAWMDPSRRPTLHYRLAGQGDRQMTVRAAQLGRPATRAGRGRLEVSLGWKVPDGRAYEDAIHLASINPTATSISGRVYPRAYPRSYPANVGTGIATVRNGGPLRVFPLVRIWGPVTNPAITNDRTGQTVKLTTTINDGDYAEIDMRARTAQLNGNPALAASLRAYLTTRQWWPLERGDNAIRFHPSTVSGRAEVLWSAAYP